MRGQGGRQREVSDPHAHLPLPLAPGLPGEEDVQRLEVPMHDPGLVVHVFEGSGDLAEEVQADLEVPVCLAERNQRELGQGAGVAIFQLKRKVQAPHAIIPHPLPVRRQALLLRVPGSGYVELSRLVGPRGRVAHRGSRHPLVGPGGGTGWYPAGAVGTRSATSWFPPHSSVTRRCLPLLNTFTERPLTAERMRLARLWGSPLPALPAGSWGVGSQNGESSWEARRDSGLPIWGVMGSELRDDRTELRDDRNELEPTRRVRELLGLIVRILEAIFAPSDLSDVDLTAMGGSDGLRVASARFRGSDIAICLNSSRVASSSAMAWSIASD
mmetsp:Transcript_4344/g.13977  ORF Transcript_4344/g.13977 Transcript_4344/m.13977 type:complete len:328 (+) Transcript_4344:264-1247(+)